MKKSHSCENLRGKQFWQKEQHRQRLWGKNKLGTFQGVCIIVAQRDGMRLEKWSGVKSHYDQGSYRSQDVSVRLGQSAW